MDWKAMIEAARAENANGIQMRGNKRYTTVAIRVEMMRRHAGALGISTEIIHWAADNGQPIVVKATVTDETGRVLATGHAEEIRGKGNVNATSALENAETSAIGRALAALGLSGGEFASANEMDGVDRKADSIKARRSEPQMTDEEAVSIINSAPDVDAMTAAWQRMPEPVRKAPAVIEAARNRKAQLTQQKDAA